MKWARVQRELDNNQENLMRYSLTANEAFSSEKILNYIF